MKTIASAFFLTSTGSFCNARWTWRGSRLAFAIALAAAGLTASAQYSVNWSQVAGGGGTRSNRLFPLRSTIVQPDAGGPMTGGAFSLTGGFWVLPGAVTVPGAPTLVITPAGPSQAKVSWVPATPGWVLQEAPDV